MSYLFLPLNNRSQFDHLCFILKNVSLAVAGWFATPRIVKNQKTNFRI